MYCTLRVMVMMDAHYIQRGLKGTTCTECEHFKPDINDQKKGMCFGQDVSCRGNCFFFRRNNTK
jgi:hypothetical protein